MADKDKTKKGKGDASRDGRSKDKSAATEPEPYSSIATHPRALASVRRIRSYTGLIAFAVAALLSVKATVPMDQVGLRALAAGCAGYMLAWWASIRVWRHLMLAEHRAAIEEINRRREQRTQEAAASG
jgi:hypothetical protein